MADVEGAAGRAASTWGLPAPVLMRRGMNAVFAAGDVVLRVSSGEPLIELAELLASAGVRVAAPARSTAIVDGDLVVTAWERLVPVDLDTDWREVGRMVALVHAIAPAAIPVPLGRCDAFPWWRFDELLDDVADLVDAAAMDGMRRTVDRHRGWEDWVDGGVCHGDVHPDNVVMTAAGAVLLDWDTMCLGPPGWDHAMLLRLPRWGWPARWYDEFAAGYGRSLAGDPTAEALADLRLVAATLMRLRATRTEPSATPQAQLRLAYWRATPDPPTWTAV